MCGGRSFSFMFKSFYYKLHSYLSNKYAGYSHFYAPAAS
jgi:hypothetical protein